MNIFNRIVVVLGLLAGLLALAIFLLVPERLCYELAGAFQFWGESLEENRIYSFSFSLNWLLFVFVGALVLVAMVVLLGLELSQLSRSGGTRVLKTQDSEVVVDAKSIVWRLEHEIAALAGIRKVHPSISPRLNWVDILLRVDAEPDVDIPAKSEEICQMARQVIEEKMGLKLRRIRVRLSQGPYGEGKKP